MGHKIGGGNQSGRRRMYSANAPPAQAGKAGLGEGTPQQDFTKAPLRNGNKPFPGGAVSNGAETKFGTVVESCFAESMGCLLSE